MSVDTAVLIMGWQILHCPRFLIRLSFCWFHRWVFIVTAMH